MSACKCKRTESWASPDPKDLNPEEVERARDVIEKKVIDLVDGMRNIEGV